MSKKSKKKGRNKTIAKKISLLEWFKQNFNLCVFFLACIVVPFITSPSLLDQSLLPKFLSLCILLSVLAIAIAFNKKSNFIFSFVDVFFSAYTLWQILSIIWAYNFAEAVFSASTATLFFISYLFVKWLFINNTNTARFMLPVFALLAFALASYGWFEFFTSEDDGTTKMVYAVKGFAAHKNLFVLQLFLYLPFLVIGYIKSTSRFKYFYVLSALLVLLLLISLLARAFMLGLLATLFTGVFLWFISRSNKKLLFNWKPMVIVLPALLLIIISIFSLRGGLQMLNRYNVFNFKESRNVQERLVLWSNTVELIKEKPVLGLGAGNWNIFFPSTGIHKIKRMSLLNKTVSRPHNDYLWIAAETGIIGLSLYLSILIALYFTTIKTILYLKDNSSAKKTLIILLSFFTGYIVIAFFDFPKERIELNFMVATILAFIVYYVQKNTNGKVLLNLQTVASRSIFLLMFVLLCGLMYIGSVRYISEQKAAQIRKHLHTQQFDKILEKSSNIKNALFNVDPANVPVKYYECFAHFSKKEYKKSISYGEEALLDSPYHIVTLKKLAAAYGELSQYEKAIPHFETVMQINPNDELNKEALVISYFNSDKKDKAKTLLKSTESEHPSIVEMRRIFGLN